MRSVGSICRGWAIVELGLRTDVFASVLDFPFFPDGLSTINNYDNGRLEMLTTEIKERLSQ